jgi:hypothetical protein
MINTNLLLSCGISKIFAAKVKIKKVEKWIGIN